MVANGWQDIKLGEFVTLQRGHDLPEPQRSPGKIPVIGSFGITGYHDKATTKGPGVTVGRSGASFGVTNYSAIDFWALNTALYVIDFHGNDEKFAYYFLKSIDFQRYNSGSAQPSLNRNFIHPISVKIPPLAEQKTIAHILGTLDDKIELNQQMNQTLEAIARALFKSWFIDFDPVRAKLDGRQPIGMDAETAALFPAEFEDSALGKIPKGWKVGALGEEFKITMGQSPPGSTYNAIGDGLPFYQGRSDFGFRYPSLRVFCNAPTRFAETGDTLVSVRAPVGDINMAHQKCCIGRGVAAIRHKQGSRSYSYYSMRSLSEHFAKFEAEGTVFGAISKQDFLKILYLVPPQNLVSKFEELAYSLDQKVEIQEEQSFNLTSMRDALLPKLLSGEICVQDAETVVEAVV